MITRRVHKETILSEKESIGEMIGSQHQKMLTPSRQGARVYTAAAASIQGTPF